MDFYSHYSEQNLPYNRKINISKMKSMLLKEVNTQYILSRGFMSGNVFVELIKYRGDNLSFYVTIKNNHTIHKKSLEHRSFNPVLLGNLSCPFFRGYDPLRDER